MCLPMCKHLASLSLFASASLFFALANPVGASPHLEHRRYSCGAERPIEVYLAAHTAVVRLPDREFHLTRQRSSVDVRYASASAALVVDGTFASFVADGHLNHRRCHQLRPVAARYRLNSGGSTTPALLGKSASFVLPRNSEHFRCSDQGKPDLAAAGARKWLTDIRDLPLPAGEGCSIVRFEYDLESNRPLAPNV